MLTGRRWKQMSRFAANYSVRTGLWAAEQRGLHYYKRSMRGKDKHVPPKTLYRDLFGIRSEQELNRVVRRYVLWQYKSNLLRDLAARGHLQRIFPRVQWKHRERLDACLEGDHPLIFTTGHAGPTVGIWAGLASIGELPVLRIQETPWISTPAGWELHYLRPDKSNEMPQLMKHCLKHLRQGGHVSMSFDALTSAAHHARVPLLGRHVPMPMGVSTLAIRSDATIVPLVPRWLADHVCQVEVLEPMVPSRNAAEEDQVVQDTSRALFMCLERFVTEHPEACSLRWLNWVSQMPRENARSIR